VRLFARKFEATYGFEHPEFFLGTYAQACPHNWHSVAFCGRRGILVKALRGLSHVLGALSNRSRLCGHCTTSRRWRAPSKTCSPWSCICTPTTTRTRKTSAGMVAARFFARRSRQRPSWLASGAQVLHFVHRQGHSVQPGLHRCGAGQVRVLGQQHQVIRGLERCAQFMLPSALGVPCRWGLSGVDKFGCLCSG
jgi:hypothetical protein